MDINGMVYHVNRKNYCYSKAKVFFIFSLTGDFGKKMESRGRNKNKNKTEKFVQSIHKFFLK